MTDTSQGIDSGGVSAVVIRGGRVVDERGGRMADVVVDPASGLISHVGDPADGGASPGREVGGEAGGHAHVVTLEAQGCIVSPGFVDLNAHLRQPGNEAAETIDTAAAAGVLGGYTAIVAMPDTDPCLDSAAVVSEVLALAKSARCDVVPAAAITLGRDGALLAPIGELVDAGVRVFTDCDRSLADDAVMRRAMEYLGGVAEASALSAVIANAGQRRDLSENGVMNEGAWSSKLGLPGSPAVAEELMVQRDLALARLTGCPLHLQQISTAGSVSLVRAAKAEGQVVTAEVSPHHLVLDESACASYDSSTKVTPPLRTPADVAALRLGVLDGTIDAIATAHSPWPVDAKEQPFDQAPSGMVGLETALAVVLTHSELSLEEVLPAFSRRPASIAGLGDRHGGHIEAGRPANLTVIDPAASWTVDPGRMASRSTNTPFANQTLTGRVRHTIVGGAPTVVDAELTTEFPLPRGQETS